MEGGSSNSFKDSIRLQRKSRKVSLISKQGGKKEKGSGTKKDKRPVRFNCQYNPIDKEVYND